MGGALGGAGCWGGWCGGGEGGGGKGGGGARRWNTGGEGEGGGCGEGEGGGGEGGTASAAPVAVRKQSAEKRRCEEGIISEVVAGVVTLLAFGQGYGLLVWMDVLAITNVYFMRSAKPVKETYGHVGVGLL